ncbi:MAG: serine/threonine protein kinase [Chroococcidiopsidaceae cyanobacterium CP_BM_ER_R8_30]|nr:serine/threonine protein kinase [Chroococcidiopsidaceae cyanobacterium CP_BM_ER_R8_30]
MLDPHIDRLLAKRYRIQKLIGTGAMSRVYLASDILLGGVPVAIKFLALAIEQQTKIRVRDRFEQEAKICALLSQKTSHIVQVTDYGVDENDNPFYVMEYLQGKSLGHVIRLQPLSLATFLRLARQISIGLQCAHQGIWINDAICPIIHRDLKPSNILVLHDSKSKELIKILDFGIAKLLQPDSNRTNYYLGTLAYSSPEQMDGKELDCRSDIYSLGIMMFEMLTGKMPLQADTQSFGGWYKTHLSQQPRSLNSVAPRLEIPQTLADLVMSCMAKAPDDRPQTMSEIIEALVLLEQRYGDRSLKTQPTQDMSEFMISWPQDKPIADIVFSAPISNNGEISAGLWVMLPQQEIRKRLLNIRYNQFLCIMAPHPMMLWITVLYNQQHGPKWLPCYLDMKMSQTRETARLLGELGQYRLLLFAREEPQRPCACTLVPIAPAQCRLMQNWLTTSQVLTSVAEPQTSKSLLKKEFDELKPQILKKLEAIR